MLKRLTNPFGKWYIMHDDLQTPENGVAIFGPFRGWEIVKRMNDSYADLLAQVGNLEEMKFPRSYIKRIYVNPREFWMTQLKDYDRG